MRLIFFLLLGLAALSLPVEAAILYGTVYDFSLQKVKDVVVEINTQPLQRSIVTNGTYRFDVGVGSYTLTVRSLPEHKTLLEEPIRITKDGEYLFDLILPADVDLSLVEEEPEVEDLLAFDADFLTKGVSSLGWIFLFLILGGAGAFWWFRIRPRKKPRPVQEPLPASDDLPDQILAILRKEGGRMHQRELRTHFSLSEAKISLAIAALEHDGKLRKIKKGRGNILILT